VTAKADTLFPFYAKDREDAERQAEEILQEHRSYERLDLKAYPSGFKIVRTHPSGTIEEDV
jgi:alpha-ketoglutarate-dependent taurine dioxygenase